MFVSGVVAAASLGGSLVLVFAAAVVLAYFDKVSDTHSGH